MHAGASRTLVHSPRGLVTPDLEGLNRSFLEPSQLFQATKEHLLKRLWWFEKTNVLPRRESRLLIGAG